MRIGEINKGNYMQFASLFSNINGGMTSFKSPFDSFSSKEKIAANRAKYLDENGEIINSYGVSGMCIKGKDPSEYRIITGVSEEGKQKLFDMVKSEFIDNDGVLNGDTTRKSEVYAEYQKSIVREDRLKATWTLGELEQEYRDALIDKVKAANPDWEIGDKFDSSILEHVSRASVSGAIDKQSRMGVDIHA